MERNGSGEYLDIKFKYGDKEIEHSIEIPFTIYVSAICKFCSYKSVDIDGTDGAVWNLMVDLDCLHMFPEDPLFLEICNELYLKSPFYEEDYEEWKADYEADLEASKE